MSQDLTDDDAGRVGPYATLTDAEADARLIYILAEKTAGLSLSGATVERLQLELDRCGVERGHFDWRTIAKLAELGPEHAQCVIGFIARAYAAGAASVASDEDER